MVSKENNALLKEMDCIVSVDDGAYMTCDMIEPANPSDAVEKATPYEPGFGLRETDYRFLVPV